uniref:Uncharacterized protein n=1 Tax=Setaria viridis TaxID=4556 RepID=A0A4V6D5H1_SETVI|nr:hypothetical protein SEVIR_6G100657v2 [Setaria viridis]
MLFYLFFKMQSGRSGTNLRNYLFGFYILLILH